MNPPEHVSVFINPIGYGTSCVYKCSISSYWECRGVCRVVVVSIGNTCAVCWGSFWWVNFKVNCLWFVVGYCQCWCLSSWATSSNIITCSDVWNTLMYLTVSELIRIRRSVGPIGWLNIRALDNPLHISVSSIRVKLSHIWTVWSIICERRICGNRECNCFAIKVIIRSRLCAVVIRCIVFCRNCSEIQSLGFVVGNWKSRVLTSSWTLTKWCRLRVISNTVCLSTKYCPRCICCRVSWVCRCNSIPKISCRGACYLIRRFKSDTLPISYCPTIHYIYPVSVICRPLNIYKTSVCIVCCIVVCYS